MTILSISPLISKVLANVETPAILRTFNPLTSRYDSINNHSCVCDSNRTQTSTVINFINSYLGCHLYLFDYLCGNTYDTLPYAASMIAVLPTAGLLHLC